MSIARAMVKKYFFLSRFDYFNLTIPESPNIQKRENKLQVTPVCDMNGSRPLFPRAGILLD